MAYVTCGTYHNFGNTNKCTIPLLHVISYYLAPTCVTRCDTPYRVSKNTNLIISTTSKKFYKHIKSIVCILYDEIQFGSRIDVCKQKLIVTETHTYFKHSNKQLYHRINNNILYFYTIFTTICITDITTTVYLL